MSHQLPSDLEILAELFRNGGWGELRVESADVSVLFSTNPDAAPLGAEPTLASVSAKEQSGTRPAAPAALASAMVPTPAASQTLINAAWHAVTAPNLGTFYRSPKPGSDPFVEIGQRVAPDTEICLLEVMKLFTSVKAGVTGTITFISAADAELVEGGQILFYIETD